MSGPIPFRIATAGQTVKFGPFVSSSDGVTPVSTAIAANDIQLFKNNATGLIAKNSGGASYLANGYFYATFDTADSNTMGKLQVHINMTSSAALPVWFDAVVLPINVYDTLYGTSGTFLAVNISSIAGSQAAANAMSSAALATIGGSATSTGTLNVSTMTAVLDVAAPVDGQLQNRQVIFDRATVTAGLRGEQAQVSTWTAATSTAVLTPSLNTSPVHGDVFRIF